MQSNLFSLATLLLMSVLVQAQQPDSRGGQGLKRVPDLSKTGKRTALVIGNGNYQHVSPLKNPVNDARTMSESLRKLGFEVTTLSNANKRTLDKTITEWGSSLKQYDVALFYFAGHGAQVGGLNYLFPVDANPSDETDVSFETFPVNRIIGKLEAARVRVSIMLLDACSNNPFVRSWSREAGAGGGLATVAAAQGMFIGFAALPGMTAADGDRANGLYTEGILQHIQTPNLTIDQAFTQISSYVQRTSNGRQTPFKSSSMTTNFYFAQDTIAGRTNRTESGILLEQANAKLAEVKRYQTKRTWLRVLGGTLAAVGTGVTIWGLSFTGDRSVDQKSVTTNTVAFGVPALLGITLFGIPHHKTRIATLKREAEQLRQRANTLTFRPNVGPAGGGLAVGASLRYSFR